MLTDHPLGSLLLFWRRMNRRHHAKLLLLMGCIHATSALRQLQDKLMETFLACWDSIYIWVI